MTERMPIYTGENAIAPGLEFCQSRGFKRFVLVADGNTWRALGEKVDTALRGQGWDVIRVVLDPENLHADELSAARVLAAYDAQERLFVAVGSGSMTDLTRFVSQRTRNPFICFPTAASVDAYTSVNAPMTIGGYKGSITCSAPVGIFTDLPTVCAAPQRMTASGFSDMLSKFLTAADWKLTALLWDATYDEAIYQRVDACARHGVSGAGGIGRSEPDAVKALMETHYESGFCMVDWGSSAPCSGAEHHISHVWEMMDQWAGREGLLHGEGVGVAGIVCADWYEQLRALSSAEAERRLEANPVPTRVRQEAALRRDLPLVAEEIIHNNPYMLQMTDAQVWAAVKTRFLERWNAIQEVAGRVPPASQYEAWVRQAGAPATAQEAGLSEEQARLGFTYGHYMRDRFSINIIRQLLGFA